MKPSWSEKDVLRWFGAREVDKARGYIKTVHKLAISPERLTAEVQGREPRPYRVTITFHAGRLGPITGVHARCTCPVGWNCKHATAAMLAAIQPGERPTTVNPEVVDWLSEFRKTTTPDKPAKRQILFYVLEPPDWRDAWQVGFLKATLSPEGKLTGRLEEWNNVDRALAQPPRFVDGEDLAILRLLRLQRPNNEYWSDWPLAGPHGDELMRRMVATGRLTMEEDGEAFSLTLGDERPGELVWHREEDGLLHPTITTEPATSEIINVGAPWFLDRDRAKVGPIRTAQPAAQISRLLTIPALAEPDLPLVAAALAELAPELPLPAGAELRVIETAPVPVLQLGTIESFQMRHFGHYGPTHRLFDYACPAFRYDEIELPGKGGGDFVALPSGETVRVVRDAKEEARWLRNLTRIGLSKAPANWLYSRQKLPSPLYALRSDEEWPAFMAEQVPALRAAGWELRFEPAFRHNVLPVAEWQAELTEDENGWLSLDMGIVVEGKRLSLPPLLHNLLRREPRWLDAAHLEQVGDEKQIVLQTPDQQRIGVPAGRIKPLLRTLIDLFDTPGDGPLRLSRLDAPRLTELNDPARWQFRGEADVLQLARRLKDSQGIKAVKSPKGFKLKLRPYQREGLAWLQFLREQQLAGILADDMGLGKTAQTLAHLLTEKQTGRLDRPALVVLPTSLLFNWGREAARCAPALKLLTLHGPDRKEHFAAIAQHDVILTTYALLWRDIDELEKHDYHLLILDEAQTVKNAASQGARAIRRLRARHRLCLTGTPLENHLGDLWSQFDFLLPGFLGDSKEFTRRFRTPIEKRGDTLRRDLLASRVRPFILRRRKEEVAAELPAKNIIVRNVELEGAQRDLYETVRSAMDKKVRDAIAAQGFARSQIVILDALLKLRQVCCDPRLLATPAAKRVKERAKLQLLMDMLPELVEEGRRILVFSQFTTMLDLIAAELDQAGLGYVTLTGATRKREAVVDRFQNGEVPVFLISLKAGGVGLNLTAADTVIHYDPWWNPAAENQATDRAHRIGQTKQVFVYKLIVAGSIEERILGLQDKKAELAAGILSEDAAALSKFSEADLRALLAPLP